MEKVLVFGCKNCMDDICIGCSRCMVGFNRKAGEFKKYKEDNAELIEGTHPFLPENIYG